MAQLNLFDESAEDTPPQARRLAPRLQALARQGIYFGTSSWKYPGWQGTIYSPEKYQVRGKFSLRKFEAECLREYAATFPVVGGDFSFYQFPAPDSWGRLFDETPATLGFGLKVPENLTVHTWPAHVRYGQRAGGRNPEFLDAEVLDRLFLRPLEPYRDRVAVLMFEFGAFPRFTFSDPAEFCARLATFLGDLPGGFRYAVEIRNPEFLVPAYFGTLSAHNVAHLFNAWTRMPALGDQIDIPGSFTADFTVARALLSKGQPYEQAVQKFEPYRLVQEPNPPARAALGKIATIARQQHRPAFLFVNNRLEGHAPSTIEGVIEGLDSWSS